MIVKWSFDLFKNNLHFVFFVLPGSWCQCLQETRTAFWQIFLQIFVNSNFFLQKQITYLSRQKIHLLKFLNLKCVTLLKQITTEVISADRTESKHFKTILVLFLKNHKAHNCLKKSSDNIFALKIKTKT